VDKQFLILIGVAGGLMKNIWSGGASIFAALIIFSFFASLILTFAGICLIYKPMCFIKKIKSRGVKIFPKTLWTVFSLMCYGLVAFIFIAAVKY
jgi:hypothetical protein